MFELGLTVATADKTQRKPLPSVCHSRRAVNYVFVTILSKISCYDKSWFLSSSSGSSQKFSPAHSHLCPLVSVFLRLLFTAAMSDMLVKKRLKCFAELFTHSLFCCHLWRGVKSLLHLVRLQFGRCFVARTSRRTTL